MDMRFDTGFDVDNDRDRVWIGTSTWGSTGTTTRTTTGKALGWRFTRDFDMDGDKGWDSTRDLDVAGAGLRQEQRVMIRHGWCLDMGYDTGFGQGVSTWVGRCWVMTGT